MIKFILIGNQIVEENKQDFAFFDTVHDCFITVNEIAVFQNREDFEKEVKFECENYTDCEPSDELYQRCRILIPDNIK